jgi:hypothetical protein
LCDPYTTCSLARARCSPCSGILSVTQNWRHTNP